METGSNDVTLPLSLSWNSYGNWVSTRSPLHTLQALQLLWRPKQQDTAKWRRELTQVCVWRRRRQKKVALHLHSAVLQGAAATERQVQDKQQQKCTSLIFDKEKKCVYDV